MEKVTVKETLEQFSFLFGGFMLDDEYARDFFLDISKKDIKSLTENQKKFLVKSVNRVIGYLQEKRDQRLLEQQKPFLICYRDEIKPNL